MIDSNMQSAVLGRTGLYVKRLGYGAAHRKPQSKENAKLIHQTALDMGINFIDTADDYGNSEELIGEFLSHRRSEYFLATKCGGSDKGHIWTKQNCISTFENSLKRLKTDVIDIMQLHNPSVDECVSGNLVEALQEMKQTGKVHWIGVSTNLPDLTTYLEWDVFDVFQIPYSPLERLHEDWIRKVASNGVGVIIRGGAALGEPGIGKGEKLNWDNFNKSNLDDLRGFGESRTSFVLRLTLTHPDAHTLIVGTTNVKHLKENVESVQRGPLDEDIYEEAMKRLEKLGEHPV